MLRKNSMFCVSDTYTCFLLYITLSHRIIVHRNYSTILLKVDKWSGMKIDPQGRTDGVVVDDYKAATIADGAVVADIRGVVGIAAR